MQEELRKIARKRTITEEEKKFVMDTSKELGIDWTPELACSNCYQDQAIVLLKHISDNAKSSHDNALKLKDGIDIRWRGVRVNSATITDEIKEGMLKDNLKHYFDDEVGN